MEQARKGERDRSHSSFNFYQCLPAFHCSMQDKVWGREREGKPLSPSNSVVLLPVRTRYLLASSGAISGGGMGR
jgi:hypothetical protein